MAFVNAIALALLIALAPLMLAYWPRIVARIAEHKSGNPLPTGLTPYVAALLSGLNATDLLACGLMWMSARTHRAVAPADDSSAAAFLRESLNAQDSLEGAGEVALNVLASNSPATFEVAAVAAGLRSCAADDAGSLGWYRDGALISKLLLGVAGVEFVLAYFIAGALSIDETFFFAGVFTVWAALHIDPRSFAGAKLTGDLRRLAAAVRREALAAGSIEAPSVLALVPAAAGAPETEAWAMAVGCHTAATERAAARIRSMAHAATGRPKVIRYTESVLVTGGQVVRSITAPVRSLLSLARPRRVGPDGATPLIW